MKRPFLRLLRKSRTAQNFKGRNSMKRLCAILLVLTMTISASAQNSSKISTGVNPILAPSPTLGSLRHLSLDYFSLCYEQLVSIVTWNMAKQYADAQIPVQSKLQREYVAEGTPATAFTESKVNRLQLIGVYDDNPAKAGQYLLYSLDYQLKATQPDYLFLPGGLGVDDSGWMSLGLPTTLVFRQSLFDLDCLGGFVTEFTPDGNEEVFRSDLTQWLQNNGRSDSKF
jgi:hypothetical protein